jgi:hypothetical protein
VIDVCVIAGSRSTDQARTVLIVESIVLKAIDPKQLILKGKNVI